MEPRHTGRKVRRAPLAGKRIAKQSAKARQRDDVRIDVNHGPLISSSPEFVAAGKSYVAVPIPVTLLDLRG